MSLQNMFSMTDKFANDCFRSGTGTMRMLLLPLSGRLIVYTFVLLTTVVLLFAVLYWSWSLYVTILLVPFAALSALGTMDLIQTRHAVLRNYPLTAHIRFILEEIRRRSGSIFSRAKKTARRFPATSARWSISAPSGLWTSGRSARKTTSMPAATSG